MKCTLLFVALTISCATPAYADNSLTIALTAKGSGGALGSPGAWKPDNFKERLAGKLTNAGYRVTTGSPADLEGTIEIETSVWKGPDRVKFNLSAKGETFVTVDDSISDYYSGGISLGSMGADSAADKAAQKIADLVRASPRIAELAKSRESPVAPKPVEVPPVAAIVPAAAPAVVFASGPRRITVTPFAVKAGADPSYSEAVASVVSSEIAKSKCLILATAPQPGDLTLQGEIVKFGPSYIVSGMIVESGTGRTVASAKVQGPEDQLPAKAEELGAKLAANCL